MGDPVLVILTAKTCPGCRAMHRNWPNMIGDLQKYPIEIENIEVQRVGQLPGNNYPADLRRRWNGWYPMLILFTRESWDKAKNNSSAKLDGKIYKGKMTPRGPEMTEETVPNKTEVLKFIKNNTESNNETPIITLLEETQKKSPRRTPTTKSSPVTGRTAPMSVKTSPKRANKNDTYKLPTSGCKMKIVSRT